FAAPSPVVRTGHFELNEPAAQIAWFGTPLSLTRYEFLLLKTLLLSPERVYSRQQLMLIWATGFVMLVGQFLGARMGSRLVLSKGQKLIRPMIVIVSAIMSARLLYDSHGQEILHWLGMN
ncbi:hypothetical protein SEEA0292_01438, partial [Salmonella enterica subsp. enterica serovar Agona str. 0292]